METAVPSDPESHSSASSEARRPFRRLPDYALIFLALFALAWAVARACFQAVTGDEGEAYVMWVADPSVLAHWYGSPNNHLLIHNPGVGVHLDARIISSHPSNPRVAGCGFLYSGFAVVDQTDDQPLDGSVTAVHLSGLQSVPVRFFRRGERLWARHRIPSLRHSGSCLVLLQVSQCPKHVDRGVCHLVTLYRPVPSPRTCLSLSSGWPRCSCSFLWALHRAKQCQSPVRRTLQWQVLAASLLPGLLVILLLPSWTLLHWQPGLLFAGGRSLRNTIQTVVEASLYQLNPRLANPYVYAAFDAIKPFLLPTLCGLAVVQLALIRLGFRNERDQRSRKLLAVGVLCFGTLAISLLAHRLAYHFFHLLMPENRTAIFVAPLVTLTIGAIVSVRPHSRASRCAGARCWPLFR